MLIYSSQNTKRLCFDDGGVNQVICPTETVVHTYYRPQRTCLNVMFSHVSVILSGRGLSGIHPLGQTPTQIDTPMGRNPRQRSRPLARLRSVQTPPGRHVPSVTTTAADDTHPTGMHSCFQNTHLFSNKIMVENYLNFFRGSLELP